MTINILAVDTATEQCSVALQTQAGVFERVVPTARGHADMILPLIEDVLLQSGLKLRQLGGLAFGRGPGSFTGVRIAVGVVQGLSLATRLPVAGISNLAAVAQRAATERSLRTNQRVLVCMDARMREVYWGVYEIHSSGLVALVGEERVSSPEDVCVDPMTIALGAGSAWGPYDQLRASYPNLIATGEFLPRAREIAQLASVELEAKRGVDAASVRPVYLRDRVAVPTQG